MWEFFIKNRSFSYLVIVALLGFGIFSILSIPKESAPEIQIPIGVVSTFLPGAPAVDIESLVTNELERGLSGSLENVKKITSTSRESISTIVVEFEADADIDQSIRSLKDKVDTLVTRLPGDAERPVVSEVNFVDQPIITLAVSGDRTEEEFSVLSDNLINELESITGVSKVEQSGARDREVSVVVDPTALLRFNLTIPDVLNGIRISNSVFPVGQIVSDGVSYNIVFAGGVDTVEEVKDIPIAVRGGQPVLVKDVATVNVGLAAASSFSRLSVNEEPSETSIVFSIYKQRGGDITELADTIQKKLTDLQTEGQILSDLTVFTVQDAGELIKKDLTQLTNSGLLTIFLVVVILVLAIGWREGLIAGLAIPLSFTIGFIGLYLSGNTINFISLFALILGIGVLVDSGIVIVEGIHKRMKDDVNINKTEAALLTVKEFSSPLISGTLTTVSMFVGLFVVSGVTGQFIASIPFTLIFVLFASLLVALGFLPLISSALMHRRATNKMEVYQEKYSHMLESWYRTNLTKILVSARRKKYFLISIIVGFFCALALIPLGLVQVVFFAQSDAEALFVEVELPEGSIKESTDIAVRRVEEILLNYDDVIEAMSITVGSGSLFSNGGQNSKLANFYLVLKDNREEISTVTAEKMRKDFEVIKDFKVTIEQPSDGPPTGSALGVKLLGDDLEELGKVAVQISQLIEEIPGTTNVTTSANSNSTEFVLTLDKEKTAALGLNPQVVSQTLRAAVYGTEATTITSISDDISVVVRLNLTNSPNIDPEYANRTTINALENIELVTAGGERVLLASLIKTSLRESSSAISHENQDRVVTVSADLASDGNVIAINSELVKRIQSEITLPSGITYTLGGETEESNQAFGELFLALVVGVVLMIGVLVLQFDSYRHTFYVLSILPFSLIGILTGLALTGSSLSFPSILGFIALSGIVVNNSILLIDMMNQSRKKDPKKDILSIVIESAVNRLRPILLTSITTIAGMVPLLFTDEIWIPLATAIIFGLAFSVVITLILIPVIYIKWPGEVRS